MRETLRQLATRFLSRPRREEGAGANSGHAGNGMEPWSARHSYGKALAVGLVLSVAAHGALLAFGHLPPGGFEDLASSETSADALEAPPTVRIPPPPEPVPTPAAAEVSEVNVDEEVRLNPPGRDDPGIEIPDPRPPESSRGLAIRPSYLPAEAPPLVENRTILAARVHRFYPDHLRDRGVEGAVDLQLYIDENGEVEETRVVASSGVGELDEVAGDIVDEMEFLPAIGRERAMGAWVRQRICFVIVSPRSEATPEDRCRDLAEARDRR